jgi:hypothetical protein
VKLGTQTAGTGTRLHLREATGLGLEVILVDDRSSEDGFTPSDGMSTEPWEEGKWIESRSRVGDEQTWCDVHGAPV